jgi:hypothetical protein
MKTITLEIDEIMEIGYQSLSAEHLQRFKDESTIILKKLITESRSMKVKKIVDDIKKGYGNASDMNPDVLLELLRTEI